MKKKLQTVLLVDDNEADNFLHRLIIEEAGIAQRIVVKYDGQQALDYLNTPPEEGGYPAPQLIFLDINMPRMNGWEFLQAYDLLPEERKGEVIVVMLTTSLHSDDSRRAVESPWVRDFLNKPLTEESLMKIMEKHFADYL